MIDMSEFKCEFRQALEFFSGNVWRDMYEGAEWNLNILMGELAKQDVSERSADFMRGKIAQTREFMDLKDMMLAAIAAEQSINFAGDSENEDEEEPQDE